MQGGKRDNKLLDNEIHCRENVIDFQSTSTYKRAIIESYTFSERGEDTI